MRVTSNGRCSAGVQSLAPRILAALIGKQAAELSVHVVLEQREYVTALVLLTAGPRSIGTKRLEARGCAEALDAVVAVVALALSSMPEASGAPRSRPPAAELSAPRTRATASPAVSRAETPPEIDAAPRVRPHAAEPALLLPPAAAVDQAPAGAAPGAGAGNWRLLFGVGADRGTLDEPTLVARVGAAARLGRGDLRAGICYGMPSVREEVSDGLERVHADFAAVALDYCHGLDRDRWIAACAGLELGLLRYSRVTQAPGSPRIEQERSQPRASALAGLALAYRNATLQPQLDLVAQLPVSQGLAQARSPELRALFGASLPF